MISIITALRDWLIGCPLLRDGCLSVECLGEKPMEYTIEADQPSNPVLKKYAGGDSLRQYPFVFASREKYGADTLQNISNSGFYEEFSAWVERQSEEGNLPLLDAGRTPQRIEVLSVGCPYSVTEKTARYQIQLNFIYYQEV